ncbi:unnamed protein product [Orchesella dallaii]|uniref:Nucleolar protein 14 n=1 Tax=Orchesella dallaii TaxID=48710 RepID=A0ABP1PMV7_9HEXA
MAKTKKKNKGSGGTRNKAKAAKKRGFKPPTATAGDSTGGVKVENPFEIRMHRTKHDNLGRRQRHEKGLPGVSRSKAIEKRRDTLLKEYKVRNKTNVLVDQRIGEKIKNMSEEEKIMRRSVMEKRRQYKQKSIFNLPSTDDILTHKGQMLMDIDRYEDPRDGSDSEDERLNEEFVSDAHFSGGLLKLKSKPEGEEGQDEDDQKSRKDIIAELILNSKMRKMEKAKEADENYELVSKLDQEFKTQEFRNLLTFVGGKSEKKVDAPPKKEDYDKIVRELHYESKTGLASNRLKTEDEIQDEELTKLKKLEKERLRRMQAMDPTVPTHRSADELTDGFEVTENIPVLSYKEDGKLNKSSDDDDSSAVEEEASEAEEEGDSDEESDAFSDLLTDDEDPSPNKISKKSSKVRDDNKDIKSLENDDIPYVLNIPKSYEGFKKLMTKYQALVKDGDRFVVRFKIVTERLVKYSLLADKSRLPDMFVYLLRMVIENLEESPHFGENVQKIIDVSSVQLHTMLLSNPTKCVELYEAESYIQTFLSNKSSKLSVAKIAFFKICSKIFCVTDFCHRVLSPIKVDMLEIIHSFSSNSYMGLLKVLAIVDVIYELSKDSKRYCPEVMRLLLDVLEAVSLPLEKVKFKRRRLDFMRISPQETENLAWNESKPNVLSDVEDVVLDGSEVLSLLLRTFDLISQFLQIQHKTRPFFSLAYKLLKAEELVLKLEWANVDFRKLLYSKKLSRSVVLPPEGTVEDEVPSSLIDRPKMLKLYEPMVEENFDGNRKRKLKRKGQTQEEARLSHKVKKEMKSAAREIIKDNAFLAKQQMKEQAAKDADRNRRVKELMGSLSNQEGDYRKLKKQKK